MPTWLRKFTFHKIQEHYNKQNEQMEKANGDQKTTLIDSTGKVQSPEFAKTKKPTSYK
jgi:hypothetical protein